MTVKVKAKNPVNHSIDRELQMSATSATIHNVNNARALYHMAAAVHSRKVFINFENVILDYINNPSCQKMRAILEFEAR